MTPAASTTTSLTTSEAAVLALLAMEGERSPYDLMKRVSTAIAYVWSPAKTQLYAVLPRLEQAGLARSRTVREGARPEKQLYRLTARGRRELDAWLAEEPTSLETFSLKLFLGGLVPDDVLRAHLAWFRETVGAQLETYRAIEPTNVRTGNDRFHYLLLRQAIERSEHLLAWADWVEGELERAT